MGAASTGRSIRDYDEKIRDLQKENFNLKLRIYFQEERAGSSRLSSSKDDLVDLKVILFTVLIKINAEFYFQPNLHNTLRLKKTFCF